MDKHALWKWLIVVVMVCASMALVYPPGEKIKLGLDLKGGTSFTVQMDKEKIREQIENDNPDFSPAQVDGEFPGRVKEAREQALEIIRNRVDASGIAEPLIFPEKSDRIVIQLPGLKEEERNDALDLIKQAAFLEFALVHEDNAKLCDDIFNKGLAPEGYLAAQFTDRGRNVSCYIKDKAYKAEGDPEEIRERIRKFHAPRGYRFMLKEEMKDGHLYYMPYFVEDRYQLTGTAVNSARVEYDQLNRPYIKLSFDGSGARRFAQITSDYAPQGRRNPGEQGRQLAIILDKTIYSAPVIQTAIHGGNAVIEGAFSRDEARRLEIVLRTGSLPAPVDVVEARSVDPSLGKDSIASGARAVVYSAVVVAVFMVIYYTLAGVVADLGLVFNMLVLPLGMVLASGFLGLFAGDVHTGGQLSLPVLTLPGIAGIALTIGMAVDANVLIFERIREEQNVGKRLAAAIESGYDKAFVTIMDSNLTTIFTAIILFIFGSGPVRGFGVTLTAGIIVSMFSALVMTRLFLNLIASKTKLTSLKMLRIIGDSHVNFLGWRKIVLSVSVLMIAGTIGWAGWQVFKDPSAVLGVDFTGGSSITFRFTEKQPVDQIRAALDSAGVTEAHIQYQREMDSDKEFLQVLVASGFGDIAKQSIMDSFKSAGFMVITEDTLGPQIGAEMAGRALKTLIFALIGMVIYISWRFEFAFAIGAMTALAHDVLLSVGIYCLLGRQISMPIIAALLAIVGYSVNDTIVIFDRIRENMKKKTGSGFLQTCNISINETLGRTVLTSVTTLIAVVMLLVFGGGAINDFALIFMIGVLVGTYSSIFIATPVMIGLRAALGHTGDKKN